MRQFDLSPLYRSTIGFDRLFSLLDQAGGQESAAVAYPPYNIERTGDNAYRLTLAVAGFGESELSIELRENTLTIKGAKEARKEGASAEMLYQGIAARAFERRFQLADHVLVTGPAWKTACCTWIWFAKFRKPSVPVRFRSGRPVRGPSIRRKPPDKGRTAQSSSAVWTGAALRPFFLLRRFIAAAARPWGRRPASLAGSG